jgi:uncharacterized membrane protein YbhN (UPF0104 family)
VILRLAITAVVLALLARGIDFGESARAIASIDVRYLALVLGLVAIDRCVMIWRWMLLLRSSGVQITAGRASRLFLVSSFIGSFLPAGVGADAARAYGLSRESTGGSEALASVAVDRLLGVQSLVLMAFVGIMVWPTNQRDWVLPTLAGAAVLGSLTFLWADVWLRFIIPPRLHDGGLIRRLLRLAAAVGRYRSRPGVLLLVFCWSAAIQVLRITQAYFLGLGLGLGVPYSYYLLFMPIGLLMLLLPISISGFGVPQGVIVWLLRPMGVPDAQSFALSTLIVLTGLAGNLPGLWLWLRERREIL